MVSSERISGDASQVWMLSVPYIQHTTVSLLQFQNYSPSDVAINSIDMIEAPVPKEVPIKYETKSFNGSFMGEDVYRQGAGPEVDKAWEALGVDCTC